MSRVIDLTGGSDGNIAILDRTESGGVLGSQYLRDDPLGAYPASAERAQFVVRNKKAGVDVGRGERFESLAPDSDYQAFCLVTDVRLLFVVGTADGDEVQRLRLSDVVTTKVERAGLRVDRLRVETQTGDRLTFACRGDLDPVVEYVDRASQSWARAVRLCEDVEEGLARCRRYLADGEVASADAALDGLADHVERARDEVEALGDGAVADLGPRIRTLGDAVDARHRELLARRGGLRHAAAQRAWAGRDYEVAAEAYGDALERYGDAAAYDGDVPSDDALDRRSTAAARERAILQAAPKVDVESARIRAEGIDDPPAAAEAWETTAERARAAMGLVWPGDGGAFHVDSTTLRSRAAAATENAIADRRVAVRRWRTAGDDHADSGSTVQAARAYDRARGHLERALDLAHELFPDLVDELEVERERLADGVDGVTGDARADDGDRIAAHLDAERVQPDPVTGGGADGEPAPRIAGPGADLVESTVRSPPAKAAGDVASASRADGAVPRGLRQLDDGAFTELVADVWAAMGWGTAVFPSAGGTVYDVIAVREEPTSERLLLWTDHRPAGRSVDATAIERIATTRDRSQGTDRATLVTTGRLTAAAGRAATDGAVEVFGADGFATLLDETGLSERIPGTGA